MIVGVRPDGTKELVAVADGYRESTDSCADVLRSLRDRGAAAPTVAGDVHGSSGTEQSGQPGDGLYFDGEFATATRVAGYLAGEVADLDVRTLFASSMLGQHPDRLAAYLAARRQELDGCLIGRRWQRNDRETHVEFVRSERWWRTAVRVDGCGRVTWMQWIDPLTIGSASFAERLDVVPSPSQSIRGSDALASDVAEALDGERLAGLAVVRCSPDRDEQCFLGHERLPDGPPVTDTSRFQLGSVTKLFTAIAILQLARATSTAPTLQSSSNSG